MDLTLKTALRMAALTRAAQPINDPRKSSRRKGRSGRMIKSNYGQWKRTKRGWAAWKERFFGKKKGVKGRYKPLNQTKKPYVAPPSPRPCIWWYHGDNPQWVTIKRTPNTKVKRCIRCGDVWEYVKGRDGWMLREDWEYEQRLVTSALTR